MFETEQFEKCKHEKYMYLGCNQLFAIEIRKLFLNNVCQHNVWIMFAVQRVDFEYVD